jgi:sterol desaturase/sphingolipid hydroxylase (fatty acid hydroxylase superfamily)
MNFHLEFWADAFVNVQQALFEAVVQPLMFHWGWDTYIEEAFAATGLFLMGVLQLGVILCVIVPLQKWRPVESWDDRRAVRVDVIYTLIQRLGLFQLVVFFAIEPWLGDWFDAWHLAGLPIWHLDDLWPGVTDVPWVTFLLYLVAFDFFNYWIHRAQHRFDFWWALHALHHSQRQMTVWTDSRNHLLDDLMQATLLATLSQIIGVEPGQYVAIVALTKLSENLSHANFKCWFGPWGERLWVSPRFHRLHHAIGLGHEGPNGVLGGCNFAVLLPIWDLLFGTANFELRYEPTGVRDQLEPDAQNRLRRYGDGFWEQQWLGLLRLVGKA